MPQIARFSLVALDCPDPLALARFYAAITGWQVADDDSGWDGTEQWVELQSPSGATIAFQRAPHHRPPVWPGDEHPQQLHLDFDVPDLDAGEQAVLAVGARKTDLQPGTSFRVFLDPVGHPFCLVLDRHVVLGD
jgi:catechol 2,3-dioxygenase-like lactoylglutathione lyase family enzyme